MGRKKEEHETALVKNYICSFLWSRMITKASLSQISQKKPEFHA